MHAHILTRSAAGRVALTCLVTATVAGCASADKTTTAATTANAASSGAAMGGMAMSGGSGTSPSVNGIKAVPTQTLAAATWQSMQVQARAMTAVPFLVYDGTSEHMVKPAKNTTFHLMVDLSDARTHAPIPYANVWATIRRAGRLVYDERLWPMIAEYMGPHYGNNVSLPGRGTYQLSLLISPPVAARHVEYQDVWLHPHRVTTTFTWKSTS